MPLGEGIKLGRYEIRAHIGTGGMGQVYLAQDTSELNRTVAIKLLPAAIAADPKWLNASSVRQEQSPVSIIQVTRSAFENRRWMEPSQNARRNPGVQL
jgi:serine/threonine protein kinase